MNEMPALPISHLFVLLLLFFCLPIKFLPPRSLLGSMDLLPVYHLPIILQHVEQPLTSLAEAVTLLVLP